MPASNAPKGKNYGSPLKAIRLHCIECVGGDGWKEVVLCPCPECKLWPFRFGRGPDVSRAQGKIVDPDKFVLVKG